MAFTPPVLNLNNLASDGSPTLDYRNFKTPFFRIFVGRGSEEEPRELPVDIYKLIRKAEVMEFVTKCSHNTLRLEILEGSREPTQRGEELSSPFYEGGNSTSNISNASGFVTDLQFLDNGGFSNLAPDKIGAAIDNIQDSIEEVSSTISAIGSVIGEDLTTTVSGSDAPKLKNPKPQGFVFSPRNRVKIVWGYLEDPYRRQFSGNIQVVRTQFPEKGQPVTEIVCKGGTSELSQWVPEEAVNFKNNRIPTDLLSQFGISNDSEDVSVEDILDSLESSGFEVIRSESFDASTLDADRAKVWMAGQTLHQFLSNLSTEVRAYYNVIQDPDNGKPVIFFIRKEEFEKVSIIPNEQLMTYKAPGSILKSVNITADFSKNQGKTLLGFNSKGQKIKQASPDGKDKIVLVEGSNVTDTNSASGPTASNEGLAVRSAAGNTITGKVEAYPGADDPNRLRELATNQALCNTVVLQFSTLGFTRLRPGPSPFKGLGKRYSGFYTINQITHELTSTGYSCKGTATGMNDGAEGFSVSPSVIPSTDSKSEAVRIFEEKTSQVDN